MFFQDEADMILIDTNSIADYGAEILELENVNIVLTLPVLEEIEKLKHNNSKRGTGNKKGADKNIDDFIKKIDKIQGADFIGNRISLSNESIVLIENISMYGIRSTNSNNNLIFSSDYYDNCSADDKILSALIYYNKDETRKDVILITSDVLFKIKARANGIKAMTYREYIKYRESSKKKSSNIKAPKKNISIQNDKKTVEVKKDDIAKDTKLNDLDEGNKCFKEKDYKNAIKYLDKSKDKSFDTLCNIADSWLNIGDKKRCRNACVQGIKLHPDNAAIFYFYSARCFYEIEKINYKIAIDFFNQCLANNPDASLKKDAEKLLEEAKKDKMKNTTNNSKK